MPWWRSLFALVVVAGPVAADWPQWLGPNRDGSTKEKVAPWQGKLEVLWRQPVDEGHSSPVVANGKVYLHTRQGNKDEEVLRCFDAKTGKPLWQTAYERRPYKGLFGNGPRATPAVADGRIYTFGITGVLTCFDASQGGVIWQVDAPKKFQAPIPFFGHSCSPLVEGGHVLLNVGGKGSGIVAFDRTRGDVAWKALDDPASYASPIVFGKGNNRQAVFLTGAGLVGLSPKEGKVLWQFPFKDKLAESSTTPVRAGTLLIGSSITKGTVALELDESADPPKVKQKWLNPKLTSYFSTPIPVRGHLYLVTGTPPPALVTQADLHCVDLATGKITWTRPKVGTYHASLLRTGDGKLLMLEENGDLVLLAADPKEYRELARTHVCGTTWAHPAISDGRLYIRDGKELLCMKLP